MQIKIYPTFNKAIHELGRYLLLYGTPQETETWQGIKPPKPFWELHQVSFSVFPIPSSNAQLANDINPNLPWADEHFKERVGGVPLNPGESYKLWPSYGNDSQMRNHGEGFSHTYMERYWPRKAGISPFTSFTNVGIRYEFGDLDDVVDLLVKNPHTRQAYLPIFFPEDTGGKPGRVPCSLGYLFTIRNNALSCTYYLRSCDYLRHCRDDIYLTTLLMGWVLDKLNEIKTQKGLSEYKLGTLTVHIANLHIFEPEIEVLSKQLSHV